jgi:hypothetical protein
VIEDVPWALTELRSFVNMTDLVSAQGSMGSWPREGRRNMIVAQAHVAEQILDRVTPGWRDTVDLNPKKQWRGEHEAAIRGIVQLERHTELAEKLGESAPVLSAASLHPWVWESARSLWNSGHYAQSVLTAAVQVNAETQNRVHRRDVSETSLFQQVFSTDPPAPGRPRLRLVEDDGSKTFESIHRGAMAFAEGCYKALRNPGSHDPQDELPEHEALEQLAALSLLARWVSNARLVLAPA